MPLRITLIFRHAVTEECLSPSLQPALRYHPCSLIEDIFAAYASHAHAVASRYIFRFGVVA